MFARVGEPRDMLLSYPTPFRVCGSGFVIEAWATSAAKWDAGGQTRAKPQVIAMPKRIL